MSKICPITERKGLVGGKYSNRIRATKFNPTGKVKRNLNLQNKKVFIPELGINIRIKASVKGFRTMKKNGVMATLKKLKFFS